MSAKTSIVNGTYWCAYRITKNGEIYAQGLYMFEDFVKRAFA